MSLNSDSTKPLLKQTTTTPLPFVSLFIICLITLVVGLSYGIVLPTLKFFVSAPRIPLQPGTFSGLEASDIWYSIIVSMYSVGELIGAFAFGRLFVSFTRLPFIKSALIALFICCVGNFLYAISDTAWECLIGRILIGFATGGLAVLVRAYVALNVSANNRSIVEGIRSGVGAMSFAIGPAIGGALTTFHVFIIWKIDLNLYRSPAWLTIVVVLIIAIMMLLFLKDAGTNDAKTATLVDTFRKKAKIWYSGKAPNWVVIGTISIFFSVSLGFSLLETLATPFMSDIWGLDPQGTVLIFVIGGALCFLSAICLKIPDFCGNQIYTKEQLEMKKQVDPTRSKNDRIMIGGALILLFLSVMLQVDYLQIQSKDSCSVWDCTSSECSTNVTLLEQSRLNCFDQKSCVWNRFRNDSTPPCPACSALCLNPSKVLNIWQFYIGFALMNVGFLLGRSLTTALYSKMLESIKKNIGPMMSYLVASGSISRVIGPIIGMSLYLSVNRRTFLVMLCFGGFYLIVFTLYMIFFKHFNPNLYLPSPNDQKLFQTNKKPQRISEKYDDN